MPIMWDDAKEKQLLLSIIHFLQPSAASIPWADVAKTVDLDASDKACSEKLKKLRYAAKARFGDPPAGADGDAVPKTPAKRGKKAAGETPAKSTGKRKSKKGKDDEAKSEEPNEDESPAKKLKTEDSGDSED
ncbi:hypothetical protein Slin15195_G048850 [Septoria linicola]|uniref:Uncharacterized protein n=1 Tax=Septoria linicola TaxID=215465 RepID=A0A9Q9AVQ7_9PEZI|nr:hypothetical protein Slin15195_G048850 [Septoria linicola]